jgi:hypothetical protein
MVDSLTITELTNLQLPEGSYLVAGTTTLQLYDISFIDRTEAQVIVTPEIYQQELDRVPFRWSQVQLDILDIPYVSLLDNKSDTYISMYTVDSLKYPPLKNCLLTPVYFYGIPFISLEDLYRWCNSTGGYANYVKVHGIKQWLMTHDLWMDYEDKFDGD